MLAAGVHICQLTHLERTYIIWPSAGTLAAGAHICRLTRLECAYIIWPSAGTLAAGRHICWPTHTERQEYIWANTLFAAQRYISAEIGWYAICATLAHMKI